MRPFIALLATAIAAMFCLNWHRITPVVESRYVGQREAMPISGDLWGDIGRLAREQSLINPWERQPNSVMPDKR
jgi:hypothetical protein